MTSVVGLHETPSAWEPPVATPLDEAVWQAWVERGRLQELRFSAACVKDIKWIAIVGLLATAVLLAYLKPPYDIVFRFMVAGCAGVVMLRAFHARQYAFAAAFAALMILYNPVVPVFALSGDLTRAFLAASAVPFVVALVWRKVKNGTQ